MNHQKPKATKWLKLKDFLGTQKVLLLLGCLLLVVGTAVYLGTLPSTGEDETVQKQQAPTLEEEQQQMQQMQESVVEQNEEQNMDEQSEDEQTSTQNDDQTEVSKNNSQTLTQAQTKLQMPVDGEIVRAFSGEELVYNKTLNAWSTHNGIDISAKEGDLVGAALAGEVAEAKMDSTLGWVVTLNHTDNQTTIYAGLSEVFVEKGDKVNAGQQLGSAGTPPFESDLGVHVHFEYLKDGEYMDPTEKMDLS